MYIIHNDELIIVIHTFLFSLAHFLSIPVNSIDVYA